MSKHDFPGDFGKIRNHISKIKELLFCWDCLIPFLHVLSRAGHRLSPVGEVQCIKCTSSFLLQIDYLN